jgi:hypothetical protein
VSVAIDSEDRWLEVTCLSSGVIAGSQRNLYWQENRVMSMLGIVPGAAHQYHRTSIDTPISQTWSAKILCQEGKSPEIQEKAFKPREVKKHGYVHEYGLCRLRSSHLEMKA